MPGTHVTLTFQNVVSDDPVGQLKKLTTQLEHLVNLHDKYKCRLSLAEYNEQTTESIAFRMLDHVPSAQLVQSTIEQFVRPYINESGLDEDETLFHYVDVSVFRPSATVSRIGLMESRLHRRCPWCGRGTPHPWLADPPWLATPQSCT